MRKRAIITLLTLLSLVGGTLVAKAITCTNNFPTSLNSYASGSCIPSSWANALEAKLGIDGSAVATSLDYLVKSVSSPLGQISSLSSSTGNIIVGSSSQWIVKSVGTNGKALVASSTSQGGVSWEFIVNLLTAGSHINLSSGTGTVVVAVNDSFATGTISGLTFTNATGTNIGITQIVATGSSTISALNFTNASGTNITLTGVASSTGFQTTGLQFNNATGTNAVFTGVASSTNFQSGGLSFNNATGTNLTLTGVASSSIFQTPGLSFNNATGTNIQTSLAFFTTASSTNSQTGGFQFNNATGTNLKITGVASSTHFQAGDIQFQDATGTTIKVAMASTTNLFAEFATTSAIYFKDATKQITAAKSFGFNVTNATSTASATTTVQRLIYQAITITQFDCSTNGSNVSVTIDDRASSTPQTAGTSVAASMTCDNDGFSTSTFSSTNLASLRILDFAIPASGLSNSTTTLRVTVKYKEQ